MRGKRSKGRIINTPIRDCFVGGGEVGARMRALDWSQPPLGSVEDWPQSLRTAVSICLASRFPIVLYWGPEFVVLYNDAYSQILASKHPGALGCRCSEVWSEIWDVIGPMLHSVMETGEATWSDDQMLILHRYGYFEECYFSFSFSPVINENGSVGGIFTAVTENTQRVIGERRLHTLRDLGVHPSKAKTAEEACEIATETLANNSADIPFALIYLLDTDGKQARLAGTAGIKPETPASPPMISLTEDTNGTWPMERVAHTGQAELLTDLIRRFGPLPGGPWPESPYSALVLPIKSPTQNQPAGFLVSGISPRRALDDNYRSFLELTAGHIASALTNTRAYEEERKRAEALAELDRAKTAFFSNVSHEFRTPLTLMLGPAEDALADADSPLSPNQRERIEVLHRNGLRLLKLVNTLLDFSRIEAGRIQAVYEPTDLAQLTSELASTFRSAIERTGMRLLVDCPPLPELIYVDREMWENIVLNLISNALKFTFEGEIEVKLQWAGDHVKLEVRDTGSGIPEEHLPHIFERFYRTRDVRSRTHEGSGIGLALVQELVKLHGGIIGVSSVVGRGTAFILTIPTGSAHLPADRISVGRTMSSTALGARPYVEEVLRWLPDEKGGGKQKKIEEIEFDFSSKDLISYGGTVNSGTAKGDLSSIPHGYILLADDNADMREYLNRLLSQRWKVKAVGDGISALKSVNERVPDLVLTDVMMPEMGGFELLQKLRENPQTTTVPVIFLSARAGEESRVEGLQAGADDYLIKPFSARELLTRVETHLKMAQMRREAESKLREMQEQLESALTAARMMVWSWDLKTDQTTWSGTDIHVPGLHTGSSKDFFNTVHPDDKELVARAIARTLRGESPYNIEFRIIKPDGQVRWIGNQGAVHRGPDGEPERFVGLCCDITERKQTEQQLYQRIDQIQSIYNLNDTVSKAKALEEIYEEALDGLQRTLNTRRASILLIDPDGVMRFKAWRGLSDKYRKAVEGHSPWSPGENNPKPILIPDVAERSDLGALRETILGESIGAMGFIPLVYQGRLLGKFMVYYDAPHQFSDDEIQLVQTISSHVAFAIERKQGEEALKRAYDELEIRVQERTRELVEANKALQSEIAERERMEKGLHQSEQRFRLLVESVKDYAIFMLDTDGFIVSWNAGAEHIMGYKSEEIIGKHFSTFYPEEDIEHGRPQHNLDIAVAEGRYEDEGWRVRKDGSKFWANVVITALRDEYGNLRGFSKVTRDTTERRKVEEERLKFSKLESVGTLAGGIAHDFNNMLAAMLSTLSVARMDARTGTNLHNNLTEAEKICIQARGLTQQLLTFSKGGTPVKKLTSIEQIIRESASFALRGSNVRCESSIEDDLWDAEVDQGQIAQVISNLVINAQQSMPQGGVIKIKANNTELRRGFISSYIKEGNYVKITVEDEGIGILEEHLSRIFDPYFTTKQKGSGLGLATAYSIIKSHGGFIDVESELGKGSRFYIYIPASEKRVLQRKSEREKRAEARSRARVLIMDDEAIIRKSVGRALMRMGYDVEYATDGQEAIEIYTKAREENRVFDLVIMDLTVPGGMGGKEAIKRLKDIDPDVRAVVSSGYSNDPVMSEFTNYGFRGVISKPYSIEELTETIHKVMNVE